jgi:hypothetical protein
VWAQHQVVDQLSDRFTDAADLLEDAVEYILAFSVVSKGAQAANLVQQPAGTP